MSQSIIPIHGSGGTTEKDHRIRFTKLPLKKVRSMIVTTGKYNKAFINSVVRGLSKSSFYAK